MKNLYNITEFLYDRTVDSGAIGTVVLSDKNGKNPLPVGAIVKNVTAKVIVAPVSVGAATISWGHSTVDAYSGTTIAIATLAINTLHNGQVAGSLIWDNANDSQIPLLVTDITTTGTFKMAIATEVITAGKIVFVVEWIEPAIEV